MVLESPLEYVTVLFDARNGRESGELTIYSELCMHCGPMLNRYLSVGRRFRDNRAGQISRDPRTKRPQTRRKG